MINNHSAAAHQEFSVLFKLLGEDGRIQPIHLALIMALLTYHNGGYFTDCFHTSRRKLMSFSGIRSINTYHKYLSELVMYGYVEYLPSWHPTRASRFRFTVISKVIKGGVLD